MWLATGVDAAAEVTGGYFSRVRPRKPNTAVHDIERQDVLLATCARFSGVALPGP